ncbi:MAG: hypothetical protein ACOY3P_08010 [Planctomycetota bacterium]
MSESTSGPDPEVSDPCESPRDPVRSAAEAVHRAEEELERARAIYHDLKQQAAQRMEAVRKTTVGELLDGVTAIVRRFPGASVTLVAVLGFLVGFRLRGK